MRWVGDMVEGMNKSTRTHTTRPLVFKRCCLLLLSCTCLYTPTHPSLPHHPPTTIAPPSHLRLLLHQQDEQEPPSGAPRWTLTVFELLDNDQVRE